MARDKNRKRRRANVPSLSGVLPGASSTIVLQGSSAAVAPMSAPVMDEVAHQVAIMVDDIARHGSASANASVAPDTGGRDPNSNLLPRNPSELVAFTDRYESLATPALGSHAVPPPIPAPQTAEHSTIPPAGAHHAVAPLEHYNARLIATLHSTIADVATYVTALTKVETVSDALALHADHLHRQMQIVSEQGFAYATLVREIAVDVWRPFDGFPPSRFGEPRDD